MRKIFLLMITVIVFAGVFYTPSAGQGYYASRIVPQAAPPAVCQPGNGDVLYRTTGAAPLSPAIYACTAANTWTRVLFDGGTSLSPFNITVTGTTTAETITRTDAGHVHLVVTNPAGSAEFGVGAAGEPHIDTLAPGTTFNIRFAGTNTWHFNADGTLQSVGVDFAGLGAIAAPANGMIIYCSDCTIASPCAGGGTGALAKRLNGAWVCN